MLLFAVLGLLLVNSEDIIEEMVVENNFVSSDYEVIQFKSTARTTKNRSVTKARQILRN